MSLEGVSEVLSLVYKGGGPSAFQSTREETYGSPEHGQRYSEPYNLRLNGT